MPRYRPVIVGVSRSHSSSHCDITPDRDSHGRHSYFQSSSVHVVLHNSSVPLLDDVGFVSASVVRENDCEKERCSPRRQPHIQDGRFHVWIFRPLGASLLARQMGAMSCAIGFLLVVQQQLDGVFVPVAYNEQVPVGSMPVADASFSLVCSSLFTLLVSRFCCAMYPNRDMS
jgi:hypothetical protein